MRTLAKVSISIVLLSFCSILIAGGGDDTKKPKKDTPQPQEQTQVTHGGGMVYTTEATRDGGLPAELQDALTEMVNTSADGLTEVTLPDGTVTVDLQGRFQSAMVVSVGEDGKLKSSCLSSAPNHTCKDHPEDKATQKKDQH